MKEDINKILEILEQTMPEVVEMIRSLDNHEETVMKLAEEFKKLHSEYPMLSALLVDSFDIVRAHEAKIEILKDLLLSITQGGAQPKKESPEDKYWIN